jgi:hypothetical protein
MKLTASAIRSQWRGFRDRNQLMQAKGGAWTAMTFAMKIGPHARRNFLKKNAQQSRQPLG